MAQQFASSKNALNKRLCEPPYNLSIRTLERIQPGRLVPSQGRARHQYIQGLAMFLSDEIESLACLLPYRERVRLLCQVISYCVTDIREE